MIQRSAIMGAGSLGTILGAYIARCGKDVTLVDVYEEHVKVLNEKGATVVGGAQFNAAVKAVTPQNMDGTYDLFIYMAKQTYNDTAIPQMVAHCGKDTVICCCQNGIPELAVAKQWPKSQICGAPVGWGATFKGPGISELTSKEDACSFHLGSLDGNQYPWIDEVKSILECMCPTIVSKNLIGDRWSKVLINAAFSGMSTVTGGTFGDVMDDEIGIQCLVRIGKETVEVCTVDGVDIVPFAGVDWKEVCTFKTKEEEDRAKDIFRTGFVPHRALVASMLQDLSKGRKCEIAQIDGVVADMGDKYGIDTPVTDMVIKIVTEIEEGKRSYSFDNLKEFLPIL